MCRGQRTTFESRFSSSTEGVPRRELRSSALGAVPLSLSQLASPERIISIWTFSFSDLGSGCYCCFFVCLFCGVGDRNPGPCDGGQTLYVLDTPWPSLFKHVGGKENRQRMSWCHNQGLLYLACPSTHLSVCHLTDGLSPRRESRLKDAPLLWVKLPVSGPLWHYRLVPGKQSSSQERDKVAMGGRPGDTAVTATATSLPPPPRISRSHLLPLPALPHLA